MVNPEATEAYDSMLHRDEAFWESIEARKAHRLDRMAKAAAQAEVLQHMCYFIELCITSHC